MILIVLTMEATCSKRRRVDINHARAVSFKLEVPGDTAERVSFLQKLQAVRKRLRAAPSKRNNTTEVIEEVLDFYLLMHTDRPERQERFQHQHCESQLGIVRDHAESMDDIFVTTRRCMDSSPRLSASHKTGVRKC